jgi:hypothetical protein
VFYLSDYNDLDYFYNLKKTHIEQNPRAKCCICGNTHRYDLTVHHEVYNAPRERLGKQLYLMCKEEGECHTKVHYIWFIKLPTKYPLILRKRRQQLRLAYCLSHCGFKTTLLSLGELLFI